MATEFSLCYCWYWWNGWSWTSNLQDLEKEVMAKMKKCKAKCLRDRIFLLRSRPIVRKIGYILVSLSLIVLGLGFYNFLSKTLDFSPLLLVVISSSILVGVGILGIVPPKTIKRKVKKKIGIF